jgi:hypothetical protein
MSESLPLPLPFNGEIGTDLNLNNNDIENIGTLHYDTLDPAITHGSLSGLTNDDHLQYANVNGRTGGQTIHGSTLTGESLTLVPNITDTTGSIIVGSGGTSFNIPGTRGSDGQLLKTDSSGNTTWQDITRDSQTFRELNISTSYTVLPTDENNLKFIASVSNNTVILPDATTLPTGWSISLLNSDDSTININIQDPGTNLISAVGSGGITELVLSDNTSPNGIWEITKHHIHNTIFISKQNGDFNTINDAILSISDNDVSNRYVIRVGPGSFNEDAIVMKPYVGLIGSGQQSTLINANSITQTIITGSRHSSIEDMSLIGASGFVGIGVYMNDSVNLTLDTAVFTMNRISVVNCDLCIKLNATGVVFPFSNILQVDSCTLFTPFGIGLFIEGTNEGFVSCICTNTIIFCGATTTTAVRLEGQLSSLTLNTCDISNIAPGNGTGMSVTNGTNLTSSSVRISGFDIGCNIINSGIAPILFVNSMMTSNNTTSDLIIDHATATGVVSGIFERSKTSIASDLVAVQLLDPVDSGTTYHGGVFMGQTINQVTNVVDLISSGSMGLINGGILSQGGALLIDVTSGLGYASITNYTVSNDNHEISRIEWVDDSITIPDDVSSYIYYDNDGVLSSALSLPNPLFSILLGRVKTRAGVVEYIEQSRIDTHHYANNNNLLMQEVLKQQYVTGSVVTANASREIAITAGVYYYANTRYAPSGLTSPATFYQYNHVASAFVFTSQTVINNTQYDSGTSLTALSGSQYVKHTLYIVGDGNNERYMLVIGQLQFASLEDAQSGDLPTPPTDFIDGVTPIASFIMQQGVTTVIEIDSERPTLVSPSTGIIAASDHGLLTGLADDDHLQYLLVNGSRAMTGGLDMGTQSITNAGAFNSVTVETHASRHGANGGADALSTAAPSTNIGASTSNLIGTANTFSRSDHQHGIDLTIAKTTGNTGGTSIIGGTGSSELLTLESTTNGTKGTIDCKDPTRVDDIDTLTTTTMLIGKSTATKVEIADTTIVTEIQGPLSAAETTNLIGVVTMGTGGTNYTLPTTRGTNTQLLQTDGSGLVTWQTIAGGGSSKFIHALLLNEIIIDSTSYTTTSYFVWDDSVYSTFNNGNLRIWIDWTDIDVDIRLQDVTNATTLGSLTAIGATGVSVISLTNPISDASVELQIRQSGAGSTNPSVKGVTLEFST